MKYKIMTAPPFQGMPTFQVMVPVYKWFPFLGWDKFGQRWLSVDQCHEFVADYLKRKREEKKFKSVQVWP